MLYSLVRSLKKTFNKRSTNTLPPLDFTNAVIDRGSFSGSDLTNAIFQNAVLTGTNFDNSNVEGADFTESAIGDFDARRLCKNPTLKGVNEKTGVDTRESAGC